jgi:hypothetical protein
MKKYLKQSLFFFLLIIASIASSCQEENVQPTNIDGNITGQDDWEKHNV